MTIKIPYNKFELTTALITAADKIESREVELKEKIKKIEDLEPDNKMKAVADFIGISLNDLINSPNMDKLIVQYENDKIRQVVNFLKEEADLSDKEAWSVMVGIYFPQLLDLGD